MKPYLTSIILTLLFSITASAQKLHVESFEEKSTDLVARINFRKDLNDSICALVKVNLAAEGAEFETVIGDVPYKTSEYWCYLPAGSKKMTIRLQGYLPLTVEFKEYKIDKLKKNTTYNLVITKLDASEKKEPEKVKTGWIVIESEPTNADVYIDGVNVGKTPLENFRKEYGTYSYVIKKSKYHDAEGTIELDTSKYEQTISLKPAFGSISITGKPDSATVLIDGEEQTQKTPCKIQEVMSGLHVVTIQKAMYTLQDDSVYVYDGKESKMDYKLEARFANVAVKSLEGAEVWVDGALVGKGTYTGEIMEGVHDFEARLKHYRAKSKQEKIEAGKDIELALELEPITGVLAVTSSPYKASVKVDGKIINDRTPCTVETILEGEHEVDIILDGYTTQTKKVLIKEGETVNLNIELEKIVEIINDDYDKVSEVLAQTQPTTFGRTPTVSDNSRVRSFTVGSVTFNMVRIEQGSIIVGATQEQDDAWNNERPSHKVILENPYYLGQMEVTQSLWYEVMGKNPSSFSGANRPVDSVSWDDCQEFLRRLNQITGLKFRLPTEAEWEYAARGGNLSRHYKYSGSNSINEVAWYYDNAYSVTSKSTNYGTHNVGTKKPNELGLYDMSGNVFEWCSNWSGTYPDRTEVNPIGPSSGKYKICRGGGWSFIARHARVSNRGSSQQSLSNHATGLRLCLDIY